MPYNKRKLLSRSFLIVALLGIFNYLFAHLAYLNMDTDIGAVYEYITLYVAKILDFVIPASIAALTLVVYVKEDFKHSMIFALVLSVARVIYYLPYYYIIYIYNYGYDSIESITLSLISSIGVVLFTALFALISISTAICILKKRGNTDNSFSLIAHLDSSLREGQNILDITNGANLVFLISSVFSLISCIIPEIIDTVSFFIEYGFDYTAGEILTIMANYLLLFLLTVCTYLASAYLRNRFSGVSKTEE